MYGQNHNHWHIAVTWGIWRKISKLNLLPKHLVVYKYYFIPTLWTPGEYSRQVLLSTWYNLDLPCFPPCVYRRRWGKSQPAANQSWPQSHSRVKAFIDWGFKFENWCFIVSRPCWVEHNSLLVLIQLYNFRCKKVTLVILHNNLTIKTNC